MLMSIMAFVKKWTLPCALALGAVVYLVFSNVPILVPIGNAVGPHMPGVLPYVIFAMLYVTFCKIRIDFSGLHLFIFFVSVFLLRDGISRFLALFCKRLLFVKTSCHYFFER